MKHLLRAASPVSINGNANGDGSPAISVTGDVNFGDTPIGTPVSEVFTIENTGTANLELSLPVTIIGAGFTVTAQPAITSLEPGQSTTFTIRADAEDIRAYSADISIVNNSTVTPYTLAISATITAFTGFAWFDPEQDVYTDSAMTTPANDGDLVGGWQNQDGSGFDWTGSGASRPNYRANGFGAGKPAFEYAGTQRMDGNALAAKFAGTDNSYSIAIVVKSDVVASIYTFLGIGSAGNAQIDNRVFGSTRYEFIRRDDGVNTRQVNAGTPNTNKNVVTINYTGTALTVRVNGVVIANGVSQDNGVATLTTASLGVEPNTSTRFWDGLIGAHLIGDRVMTAGEIDAVEKMLAGRSGIAYPFELVSIASPVEHRTFQRSGGLANIAISGAIYATGSRNVEARFNNGAWSTIASGVTGAYSGTLSNQAEGQGDLEVRLTDVPTIITRLENIGIGVVCIGLGQSNQSGRWTNYQSWSHETLLAKQFGNNYVWSALAEPTDLSAGQIDAVSSESGSEDGSYIPLLATHIMANQAVPFAYVPCAKGGSSITSWLPGADHLNRATLYGSANYRIQQIGGAEFLLWWQGEQDALAGMSQTTYNGHLDTIANAFFADCGVKLLVCKIQNCTGISAGNLAAINAAIEEAWGDNPNVLQGPDLSDLVTDDSFHLMTDAKAITVAQRWYDAMY